MSLSDKYNNYLINSKWIKKRNKILKRDKYKCTVCNSVDDLRVHHTYYYTQFTPPWKYPDRSLLTLCECCHIKWHMEHENTYKKKSVQNVIALNRYRIESVSKSGRKIKYYYVYAKSKEAALNKFKCKGLPVFRIKQLITN